MAAFRRLALVRSKLLSFQGTQFFAEKQEKIKAGRVLGSKCRFFSEISSNPEQIVEKEQTTVQKVISILKSDSDQQLEFDSAAPSSGDRMNAFRKSMDIWKTDLNKEEMDECLKSVAIGLEANDPKLGKMYYKLGQLFNMQNAQDKALLCCEKAMEVLQDKKSVEYCCCLHLASSILQKKGEHEASIDKLKEVVEICNAKGEDDEFLGLPFTVAVNFTLATALSARERHEEAAEVYLSAISMQEKLEGKNTPELADGYLKVAEGLAQCFRVPEAVEFCNKALKIHAGGGDSSLAEAATRRLLAILHKGMGEVEKAVEQNKVVREILAKHGRKAEARLIDIGIGVCEIGLKNYDEAEAIFKGIISDSEDTGLVKGLAHINFAKICLIKGDTDEAMSNSEKAMVIFKKNKSTSMMVAEGFSELASVFESMEDYETAMELFDEAQKIYAGIPGQANAVAGAQAQMGSMCYILRKFEQAVTYLSRAAKILEMSVGKEHQAYGSVMNQLGVANLELKNLVAACDQFEKAKVACLKACGAGHEDTLAVNHNLVVVYSSLCRWDKAIKCQSEILKEMDLQNAEPDSMKQEREVMKDLELALVTQSL